MTRRYEFEVSARTAAPVEAVWPLVGEAARWKDWSWMTRSRLLREGSPPPDGVGALRQFGLGPGGSQEEVVVWEPPRHLAYVAVRGLPVRYYRADVHLDDDRAPSAPGAPTDASGGTTGGDGGGPTGTVITWRCTVEALVPGTGAVLRAGLQRMVRGFATRVCAYADRQAEEA